MGSFKNGQEQAWMKESIDNIPTAAAAIVIEGNMVLYFVRAATSIAFTFSRWSSVSESKCVPQRKTCGSSFSLEAIEYNLRMRKDTKTQQNKSNRSGKERENIPILDTAFSNGFPQIEQHQVNRPRRQEELMGDVVQFLSSEIPE